MPKKSAVRALRIYALPTRIAGAQKRSGQRKRARASAKVAPDPCEPPSPSSPLTRLIASLTSTPPPERLRGLNNMPVATASPPIPLNASVPPSPLNALVPPPCAASSLNESVPPHSPPSPLRRISLDTVKRTVSGFAQRTASRLPSVSKLSNTSLWSSRSPKRAAVVPESVPPFSKAVRKAGGDKVSRSDKKADVLLEFGYKTVGPIGAGRFTMVIRAISVHSTAVQAGREVAVKSYNHKKVHVWWAQGECCAVYRLSPAHSRDG